MRDWDNLGCGHDDTDHLSTNEDCETYQESRWESYYMDPYEHEITADND